MLQRLLPLFSLVALFVGLSIASPYFLTGTNLSSVARQTAVINIMALGMTLVIVAGGIDLSVGAMLAFELSYDRDPARPASKEAAAVVARCRAERVLVITAGPHGNVIRMLPPLVITDAELDRGLDAIERAVRSL